MGPPKKPPVARSPSPEAKPLPPHAQLVAKLGPKSSAAVSELFLKISSDTLSYGSNADGIFETLQDSMNGWDDTPAAEVLSAPALLRYISRRKEGDFSELGRWLRIHKGDPRDVLACIDLLPPKEINIIKLLSRAGSQKVVFLANWQIAQREVVLKRFIGEGATTALSREKQTHPLSISHPNIIETHSIANDDGEIFLVEKRLSMVLNDDWSAHGVHEAANLLRDITQALIALDDRQLVHGDIKPDNLGYEDGRYILLDFGICRPQTEFGDDYSATGSLRTRAPEILIGQHRHSSKSDIWALGATVYNSVAGRFPLFDHKEAPPRVSKPTERSQFLEGLQKRVNDEWASRVDFSLVPEPLRGLLSRVLARDPEQRPSAVELIKQVNGELSAYLRPSDGTSMLSPKQEISQLERHLKDPSVLALMPENKKRALRERLGQLRKFKGLSPDDISGIARVTERL